MSASASARAQSAVPVLGLVAWSGTGKTTLLASVIRTLSARGLEVGVIKHAHHGFDIDRPGKDSFRLRQAGASRMLVASRERWALMVETPGREEPELLTSLQALHTAGLDLVLVEGFKHERFPKIEVHRPSLGRPLLFEHDDDIIAVASDAPLARACPLPLLDMNSPSQIADFVLAHVAAPVAVTENRDPSTNVIASD